MPVDTKHEAYTAATKDWQLCRDCAEGERLIKERGQLYLPILSGQDEAEYNAYKARALFYNAMSRTLEGLVGLVFRKDPEFKIPENLKDNLSSVDLSGMNIWTFSRNVFDEVLLVGRYGILVDLPEGPSEKAIPYFAGYVTERILNWKYIVVNGRRLLSMVVLEEEVADPGNDEFEEGTKTQYRVLKLDEESQIYRVEIWEATATTKDGKEQTVYTKTEDILPTFRGQPLKEIPFAFVTPFGPQEAMAKPPLLDLAQVNVSHYRTSADLEHGAHFTALPTAWIAGFPTDSVFTIGSAKAWVSDDVNAKAGFLEFTGQGLQALESRLEKKEQLMAILGARMLEAPRKGVEAAETARIRQAGESASLASMAISVAEGIEKALARWVEWQGGNPDDVAVGVNTDYVAEPLTAQEVIALFSTYQAGGISWETFVYNLKRGEVLPPGVEAEDEMKLIEARKPVEEEGDPLDLGGEDEDNPEGDEDAVTE